MVSKYIKSKKGTTMLEVIAAVCILAIVVMGVLTAIGFSQMTILSRSMQADAAGQAQSIVDMLITEMHTKDVDTVKLEKISGAEYVSSFPNPSIDKQFTVEYVKDSVTKIEGYKIKAAVYYTDSNGRKCAQLTAFSAKDGG